MFLSLSKNSNQSPYKAVYQPNINRMLPLIHFGKSSALNVPKQGEDPVSSRVYIRDMQSRAKVKAAFFTTPLKNLKTQTPHTVIDLGCCTGDITREMSRNFPKDHFIGIDISPQMIEKAKELDGIERQKTLHPGNTSYHVSDATELRLKPNSVDAFTLSAVFHELYSYNNPAFSKEALTKIFQGIFNTLKPLGKVIIRDPAKPENANELLTLKAIPNPAKLSPKEIKDLLAADPKTLDPTALLRRFIYQFEPAKNKVSEIAKNTFKMPAWLVTEFLQHRRWTDTPGHWDSEIKEQYGVFTQQEMLDFAKNIGFTPVTAKDHFKFKNRDYEKQFPDEYIVKNQNGKLLEKEVLLPSIVAIFEKPV